MGQTEVVKSEVIQYPGQQNKNEKHTKYAQHYTLKTKAQVARTQQKLG